MDDIPTVDFSSLSLPINDERLMESDLKAAAGQLMNAFDTFRVARLCNTGLNEQLVRIIWFYDSIRWRRIYELGT